MAFIDSTVVFIESKLEELFQSSLCCDQKIKIRQKILATGELTPGRPVIRMNFAHTMATLLLAAIDLTCDYQDLRFIGPTIEDCFEALTELRCAGWEIIAAYLLVEDQRVALPIEAFDGAPVKHHVQQLSLEWERLLNAS